MEMEQTKEGYYDIEINLDDSIAANSGIDDAFYLKDLQQRKLFLLNEVAQITVADIVHSIMQYNAEDKGIDPAERKPILLYISSPGGEVSAGFELIDVITSSKTPVYTINLGAWYSMAFLIGIAGHKRFATPYSKFLMHDGQDMVWDSGAKVQDRMEFQRRMEQRIKNYIISHSKITDEEYDSKYRVEWYLFADEAKEKGFCDYILGTDCDIDEVV